MYTDDPIADFERHDREQAEELERLPVCAECGDPIQDEMAFYFHGEWVCEACMDSYKRTVESYVE